MQLGNVTLGNIPHVVAAQGWVDILFEIALILGVRVGLAVISHILLKELFT
jgi:hypothetical protein